MGGYDNWPMHGDDGSTWLGAGLLVGLLLLTAVLVLLLLGRPSPTGDESARRILDERFARGELDEREYQARRSALRR
jgi:putative membrane protein